MLIQLLGPETKQSRGGDRTVPWWRPNRGGRTGEGPKRATTLPVALSWTIICDCKQRQHVGLVFGYYRCLRLIPTKHTYFPSQQLPQCRSLHYTMDIPF